MKHLILASLIAVLLLCAAQGARSQDISKLLSQYEAECYADSTWTEEHRERRAQNPNHAVYILPNPCWEEWSIGNQMKCVRPDHWKKYWKHREPTYQGFKEFIKKEMK